MSAIFNNVSINSSNNVQIISFFNWLWKWCSDVGEETRVLYRGRKCRGRKCHGSRCPGSGCLRTWWQFWRKKKSSWFVNRSPPSPTIAAPRGPLQSSLTSSQTLGFLIFVTCTSLECQISEKRFPRKNRKKSEKIVQNTVLLLFRRLFTFPGSKYWIAKIQEEKPYEI